MVMYLRVKWIAVKIKLSVTVIYLFIVLSEYAICKIFYNYQLYDHILVWIKLENLLAS